MAQRTSTFPRVAVVGGGIAGTLCSLVLKHRGLTPILIDQAVVAGRNGSSSSSSNGGTDGLGGRLRGVGCQFLRATDPRLQAIMGMLDDAKLVRPWKGRFGMLGSQGGGFLPAEVVTSGRSGRSSGGIAGLAPATPESSHDESDELPSPTDTGDFCQFVQSSHFPTYIGNPSMKDLCPGIATLADISTMGGTEVIGASMATEGGWLLELQPKQLPFLPEHPKGTDNNNSNTKSYHQHFDAMVLATHNPLLASSIVQGIVNAELHAGNYKSMEDAMLQQQQQQQSQGETNNPLPLLLLQRLSTLSNHLQQVREEGRRPLYSIQLTYPPGFSHSIPFDAVSIPGSSRLQFLVREGSKRVGEGGDSDVWTGISTSQFASSILDDSTLDSADTKRNHVQEILKGEVAHLLSPYFGHDVSQVPLPTSVYVKQWGAAICGKGLELEEDSITLSGWRLGMCGDYIRKSSAYSTPWEAAALSGLEAGERMSSLLLGVEPSS